MEPEFVSSQCGTRKLVINGFTYVCQRKGERRTHWRCDRYQKDKCRATALTENGKVCIFTLKNKFICIHCLSNRRVCSITWISPLVVGLLPRCLISFEVAIPTTRNRPDALPLWEHEISSSSVLMQLKASRIFIFFEKFFEISIE